MRVKICGITRPEDARLVGQLGADAIGVVVFSEGVSHRAVSVDRAREIFRSVGPFVTRVAVSHTTSRHELEEMMMLGADVIQISYPFDFPEKPDLRIIRVIGRGQALPQDCDAVIIDESHGKGKPFDLSFAREAVKRSTIPVILAGGLTSENVTEAIRSVHPYAVDVASGVESAPGIKDPVKVQAFIKASRSTIP